MNNQKLAKKWIELKAKEDELKKARVEVEKEILNSGVNLKKSGANSYLEMLTITTGFDRKWDQEGLKKLHDEGANPFPFKLEFKEDKKLSSALEEMALEYWSHNFEPLLTVKPKNPSFKVR